MRLTLRTLLAYLDDTLEPSQAKIIGQKVAESTQAQELIEHIKQVTRRRRITTPDASGVGGKFDPNTIAEYLDNAVSPEQASEIEQVCLASDVHMAEIAACHQILALVLGEPSLVPPTAKQRMYALVKGPEAIPFRKPSHAPRKTGDKAADHEEDETLRMGLPSVATGGKWSHRLMLVGAGALAASLLFLAIWQTLDFPGNTKTEGHPKGEEVAQGNGADKKPSEKTDKEDPKPQPPLPKQKEETDPLPLPPPPKLIDNPADKGGKEPPPPFKPEAPVLPEVRYFPPDNRILALGKYVVPLGKETSVVVARPVGKPEWKRLWGKNLDVQSGHTFVSLPGCRGDLELQKDVLLTLWGSLPEILPSPPLLESAVDLHSHDAFDVDLTLLRGRIVLASQRADKPVLVRVRFENPTQPKEAEFVDLALQNKGAKVLIDRWSFFPPGEPFYKDPKNVNRLGPAAGLGFFVLQGNVLIRLGDVSYGLPGPPGRTLLVWNSLKGLGQPQAMESLPEAVSPNPPPPPGFDKKVREEMLRARDDLNVFLFDKAVDVGLAEAAKSAEPSRRIMAVRCFAALGDLGNLVDSLADERFPEVRQTAVHGLHQWITSSRDNEYKLYEQLKTRYTLGESEKIMELFHGVSRPDPIQLDILVDYLNNSCLIIRQMAHLNLSALVPAGAAIPYDPTAEPARRITAQKLWREAIRKAGMPQPKTSMK